LGRKVILDTNILIAYERDGASVLALDDQPAIAALSVAEFRVGMELADTDGRAQARANALAKVLGLVEVLDYTQATAAHHAKLIAHTRRSGRKRSQHDLILAAHAAETGRVLLSRDAAARFGDLPGVQAADQ
jgi:tRNA(fMet)-specific endonuclease VapC